MLGTLLGVSICAHAAAISRNQGATTDSGVRLTYDVASVDECQVRLKMFGCVSFVHLTLMPFSRVILCVLDVWLQIAVTFCALYLKEDVCGLQ